MAKPTSPTPSARLALKVVPGSSRDQIVGWLGDALKIKVMAPPEKGRANEAVVAILADRLGVREDDVKIVAAHQGGRDRRTQRRRRQEGAFVTSPVRPQLPPAPL